MPTKLAEICFTLKKCAEMLEEDIRVNINECHNTVFSGSASDVKLALDKAKDNHYKETLKCMSEIIVNIKKMIYHEEQIRNISAKEALSDEDLKNYSFIQTEDSKFDNRVVMRNKRRKAVSSTSVYSLDAWNTILDHANYGDLSLSTSLPCLIPRRNKEVRKLRPIVSSTYSDFSEAGELNSSFDTTNEMPVNRYSDSSCRSGLCSISESGDENDMGSNDVEKHKNKFGEIIIKISNMDEVCNISSSVQEQVPFKEGYQPTSIHSKEESENGSSELCDKEQDGKIINRECGRLKTLSEEHFPDSLDISSKDVETQIPAMILEANTMEESCNRSGSILEDTSRKNKDRPTSIDSKAGSEILQSENRSSDIFNCDEDDDNVENGRITNREYYPLYDLVKTLSEENFLETVDTKPKIIHVVFKQPHFSEPGRSTL